jgi:hypothetical protein
MNKPYIGKLGKFISSVITCFWFMTNVVWAAPLELSLADSTRLVLQNNYDINSSCTEQEKGLFSN